MSIKISDDFICLEIDGIVVATARMRADGWGKSATGPGFFDRDQAITALTVTELLESGRDGNEPAAKALCEELR